MFREMLRKKQALSEEECIAVLKTQKRGVLAVLGDEDYPYALPINHYYNDEDGHIYFHGAKFGHRVDAVKRHDKVSFCVYDEGYRREGEWALNIKSVIVFGRLVPVEDEDKMIDLCRRLSRKFTDDESYIENEIKRAGFRTLMYELIPEHMSGKLVKEA
ncbi:MAG: pyridoxamine 5'-phosphate oxidase family protein [Ruminococcus sp.]|uniref:pyridoxamine 5'-phosphate oxidase family protein n=1 Tax=Ruminococcus sp. TaxID=41978 RepID=UPI0025D8C4C3|nr:pyridoxamine 5'-phosphate oxidase family protein [Ruminococcus sp.]MBR0530276.1 pyridoxamine 5'-phosphate oxidase family protein [Ruminococcus sp.]